MCASSGSTRRRATSTSRSRAPGRPAAPTASSASSAPATTTTTASSGWSRAGCSLASTGRRRSPKAWRQQTFANDPFIPAHSNIRGTVAFAFAQQTALTTQVYIGMRDNSATHDKEPFVPFGRVLGDGMDVADRAEQGTWRRARRHPRRRPGPVLRGRQHLARPALPPAGRYSEGLHPDEIDPKSPNLPISKSPNL